MLDFSEKNGVPLTGRAIRCSPRLYLAAGCRCYPSRGGLGVGENGLYLSMKTVEVVAAVIIYDGEILCVQRPDNKYAYISKKFEFPGGKVEKGEHFEDGLMREIREELKMDIQIESHFLTVEHPYPDFFLIMHSYLCSTPSKELTLMEHIDYKWLKVNELKQLDWAGADVPIVEKLQQS